MATTGELADKIAAVCPIDGVFVGRKDQRETWGIHFRAEATDSQRAAAKAILAAFDFNAPSVPASVKMWQAKTALDAIGKLETANTAIAASGNRALQLAWEYAADISRSSPSVAAIGKLIGLDDAGIDALFVSADQMRT